MKIKTICLIALLHISCAFCLLNAQTKTSELNSFVRKGNLEHAGISFDLLDLTTGKRVASYNENRSLIPASVLKLISTAAMMDYLKATYQCETALFFSGKITENGVLSGDIIIKGNNDPTLGSEYTSVAKEKFLRDWFTALQKAGITSIKGKVVVDDQSGIPDRVTSPKWMWEDMGNYYAPGIYGISVFDNTYRLYLKSEKSGTKVSVSKMEPQINELTFIDNVRISNEETNDVYVNGMPYSYKRILNGTMKENQASYMVKAEIPDPGLFLAEYFTDYLKRNGITVEKSPTTTRLGYSNSDNLKKLYSTTSPILGDMIKITNFRSNNHYAEYLSCIFEKESEKTISDYWSSKGFSVSGQFIYDGSGLSPADAISTSFITAILAYMKSNTAYYNSIPLAGKEGTVSAFLKGSKLEGKARIKSGSMSNVQSYAGYIEYLGKQYAFAIIVNNYTGERAVLRKQIEQLLVSFF